MEIFNCRNPKAIKLVTRLHTDLSHLRKDKFKHSFQDSLNPICSGGTNVESCTVFRNERLILLNIVKNIDNRLLDHSNLCLTQIFLFGNTSLDVYTNPSNLNAIIDFVISSKRFEKPLF